MFGVIENIRQSGALVCPLSPLRRHVCTLSGVLTSKSRSLFLPQILTTLKFPVPDRRMLLAHFGAQSRTPVGYLVLTSQFLSHIPAEIGKYHLNCPLPSL